MARSLLVKIEGDATGLNRAFKQASKDSRTFERDVGKIGRGALGGSGVFRGLGRSIAFASTAFLGGFGLVTAIRASLSAMSDLENVSAQTEATLKSTGRVAGVTAEHIAELGEKMSNLTGVNQAEVRSAENLLLTFTNVRNVAGENNKIFDEATKAALDLSAALHTDLRSATLLVGKALQNPIKGLQQLNRATGGLSESQTKLVRRLVASGNVLGAQKVILRDLNRSFKGAAEVHTLSADLAVLQNNVTDLGAKIAENFAPELHHVIDELDAWITNTDNQNRILDDSKQVIQAAADVLEHLRNAFNDLNKITGSTKRSLELLVGAFLAFKGLRIVGSLTAIAADFGLMGTNAEVAAGDVGLLKTELQFPATLNTGIGTTAGGVKNVGTQAKTAAAETTALKGSLLTMADIGPIAIAISLAIGITETKQYKDFRKFIADLAPGNESTGKKIGKALFGTLQEQLGTVFSTDPNKSPIAAIVKQDIHAIRGLRGEVQKAFDVAADVPRGTELKRLDEEGAGAKPPGEGPAGLTKKELAARAARLRQAREALRKQTQDQAQLAIDQATLTKSTADDLKALRAYNDLLKRRIAGGHDVIDNEREQISVQKQIADLQQQIAQTRIDRLQFGVDVAAATAGLADDLRALGRLRSFLERRLARDEGNLDLEKQIFDVNQQIADVRRRRRDARQFRELGLGPTGEDIVPGVKGLKRQLASVEDAISGTFLDTRKTKGLLGHIRAVLSGGLGSVSADVRSKVQQILADLKAQLKQSSVDVTRFQETARGQFTLAGAHPGGRLRPGGDITINGGIHVHGVQNVKQLEDALAKRAKQRAHARRGNR